MKSVIGANGEEIKAKSGSEVEPFHAYISLVLAMLKEPFMSSDAKYLIIQSSFSYLEDMGYTTEQIQEYMKPLQEVVRKNIVINSFMG